MCTTNKENFPIHLLVVSRFFETWNVIEEMDTLNEEEFANFSSFQAKTKHVRTITR